MNPGAARLAQATRARMFHSTTNMRGFAPHEVENVIVVAPFIDFCHSMFDKRFVYRENRVPYYQRLYQKDDGKRQWWKVRAILCS